MKPVGKKIILVTAILTTAFGIALILSVALRHSESSWPQIAGATVIGVAVCASALVWAADSDSHQRKR